MAAGGGPWQRSLASVFAGLRPVLGSRLVDDVAWRSLTRLACLLPLAVGDHEFGFEVPLGTGLGSVDFGFAIRPGGSLARVLAAGGPAVPASHALAVSRYLIPYDRDSAPLGCLLFEYDSSGGRSVPGVFAIPFEALSFSVPGVLVNLLALLRPAPTVAQRRRLGALVRALPVSSVGFFPGRVPSIVRVNAPVFQLDDLDCVARSLGWTGDRGRVRQVLRELPDGFSYQVGVDVDPFGRVGGRFGVELHLPAAGGPWIGAGWLASTPVCWVQVFDALVASGLCAREKVGALLSLHGSREVPASAGNLLLAGGLNHLKLSFSEQVVRAKAYPAFRLLPPRSGVGAIRRGSRGVGR